MREKISHLIYETLHISTTPAARSSEAMNNIKLILIYAKYTSFDHLMYLHNVCQCLKEDTTCLYI